MPASLTDCVTLNNGVKMPWFGFGTFKIPDGEEVEQAVAWALEAGYRSIDTAGMYRNERGVGRAIKASGIPREEIFLTTKIANDRQGYGEAFRAFDDSLELLGVDYVDLYLVHRAVKGKYPDTWRAFEEIYKSGRARAIGVSNFLIHHLEDILQTCTVVPAVNQVEFHPYLTESELRAFCASRGIAVESWSPLIRGQIFDDPVIPKVAEKHGKSVAQVVLRWGLQHGVITIPKSVHKERIAENADVFDFRLDESDMSLIDSLNRDWRMSSHPDNY